jgi:exodeoxyribonuclease-5
MIWPPQQEAALNAVAAWFRRGEPQIFRLFGYAGTGKTTLAKQIAEDVDGDVAFAAFTGKAALVMRSRGCKDARTIHSLIYRPRETDKDEPTFVLNEDSAVMAIEELVHHLIEARKRAGSLCREGRKTLRASPGEELKS